MATNLRDLLGLVTDGEVNRGPDPDTLLPQYALEGYNVQYIGLGNWQQQMCQDPLSNYSDYHHSYYPNWTVPSGATDVIFEIWGGGGGGAVSCCCSHGVPGGAGAYAFKRLSGSEVVPGCQYQICIAQSACYPTSKCGRRGCKTYILGHELTNFCAEGGHGGCSYCFEQGCYWLTHRRNESGCKSGCCAIYYGATGGAVGLPGATESRCYSQRCYNKYFFPYPGGLVNSKGGYVTTKFNCGHCNCMRCEMKMATKLVGFGQGQCSGQNGVPGFGGASAQSCENGPVCGRGGHGGMARISYK